MFCRFLTEPESCSGTHLREFTKDPPDRRNVVKPRVAKLEQLQEIICPRTDIDSSEEDRETIDSEHPSPSVSFSKHVDFMKRKNI